MVFVLHVSIELPCLPEQVVTYLNEVYYLKEHEAVFLKIFVFCFRLNGFTSKILNLPLPNVAKRGKGVESRFTIIN